MSIRAKVARAVDGAVLVRLGLIGVAEEDEAEVVAPAGPDEFWRDVRLGGGAELLERAIPRLSVGPGLPSLRDLRPEVVELTGPSHGPGTHWGARRLRARVVLHPDPGAPLVLCLHGYAVPAPWYEERTMRQLLRRGMSAARLELPFHLTRRIPGRPPGSGFFSSDTAQTLAVLRQAVEDSAAVLDWGRRRGTRALGVHGISLGGLVGGLVAALAPLDSAVLVTPPCELAHLVLETAPLRLRRALGLVDGRGGRWAADAAGAAARLEVLLAPATLRRLVPRTDPARIVVVVADHDNIVGAEPVRELARQWDAELWAYRHGHVTLLAARGLAGRLHQRLAHDLVGPLRPALAG